MSHPYPFPVYPEMVENDYPQFTITALDNPVIKGDRVNSSLLPNLELQFVNDKREAVHIRFRVDLKDREFGVGKQSWPFSFEEKVVSFAMHVGEKYGFSFQHTNSNGAKGNRRVIKDLMHSLFDPWSNGQNIFDPADSVRILRTHRPTTKLSAWNYREGGVQWLKEKPVNGIYGHFRLGTQIGFFVIDPIVGSLLDHKGAIYRTTINDAHRLVEEHRMHILGCWPFATALGLEMEYADANCFNFFDLNQFAELKFFRDAVVNGDLEKVIDRHPTVRPSWGGSPKERWNNMTIHAVMRHFMDDGLEVPRFLANLRRHDVPLTATFEVDVMEGDSIGIFLPNKEDPVMTLPYASRAKEQNNV